MEAAGTALAVASLVAKTVFTIADISSGYRSAYPELARVEKNLVSIREALGGLPLDGYSIFENVLANLAANVEDIQAFVDKRVKEKAGARALLVKLGWHGDRVKLERMEAALETSKSTLMIAIQAWQLVSRGADREELVAGLKMSMQEAMTKMSGYEFGSKRIQDVRAHLDSVSRSLREREPNAGVAATVTEVDMGKPLTTWPTFGAWLDSFTPSQEDIQQDERTLTEGQKRWLGAGQGDGVDKKARVGNGTCEQKNGGQKTVKVCITGLDGAADDSTARIMTLSPQTEIAEVLETLHREGCTWVTGFQVGEGDNAPLVGPIIGQSERCMVTVTEEASSYGASAGYAINLDETLISFFNRTLMFRRPTRDEISISHTFDAIRVVDNYRGSPTHGGAMGIQLMRTTRLPDDGETYHLAQDFGPFPLLSVKDFEDTLPPRMKEQGGMFIPMLLRESLFLSMMLPCEGLSFGPDPTPADELKHETFAMRVYAGRANVISAADPVGPGSNTKEPEQDYIVVPKQGRLDGFTTASGCTTRQFHAASLGSYYSAESQVSGHEVGGLQVQFAPRFKRNAKFQELGGAPLDLTATPRELGLKSNGLLIMEAGPDPVFSPPAWDTDNHRPPAFDGWGYREGEPKSSDCGFPLTSWGGLTSESEGAPFTRDNKDAEKSTPPPRFTAGGFPMDILGVPYQEGRPQLRQPTSKKAKVGKLEPARPSTVSDLFAAARVPFQTPLFVKPVRPITVEVDVKAMIMESYEYIDRSNVPIAMKMAVTTSVFEDIMSFHDRVQVAVGQQLEGVLDEEYYGLDLGCVDFMGHSEIRGIGEPCPSYMPIHKLAMSKTFRAEMNIEKLVDIQGDTARDRMDAREFWLSLAAGAVVEQKVYKDNNPRLWNWDASAVINIQIINSVAFKSVTGLSPPIPAISFEDYTRAGLPLLSFYGGHNSEPLRLSKNASTTGIRSVGDIDRSHAAVGVRMKPDQGPVICAYCEHRLCNAVLVPCRHIFCTWCIRFSMTEGDAVTCGFCREPAPTVNIYAASTRVDDRNNGTVVSDGRGREGVTPVRKLKGLFDRERTRDLIGGNLTQFERRRNPEIGDLIPTIPPSGLMMAQVLLECEMGLRSEAEVKDLAIGLFNDLKTEGRDTDDPLKLFVAMGASVRRECEEWGEWNPLVRAEKKTSGRDGFSHTNPACPE